MNYYQDGAWSHRLFPPEASQTAGDVDSLAIAIFAVAATFTIGISLALLAFTYRYWHHHRTNRTLNISRTAHWGWEISWSLIPLAIMIWLFTWGAREYVREHQPPTNALNISIVAKQWMWKVSHESGRREIDELHLPLDRPIRLTMISEDVIHSFYVPAFRAKHDVLPARFQKLWFHPTRTGSYELLCAEYCGTSHSRMRGTIHVMSDAQYTNWAYESPIETQAERGLRLIKSFGCLDCHGPTATKPLAPSLVGLYKSSVLLQDDQQVIADENYLRTSILEPQQQIVLGFTSKMPSFQGQIDAEQLSDIVSYLRSVAESHGRIAGPSSTTSNSSETNSGEESH